MKLERKTPIPERKTKSVQEFSELMKNKKTILIVSIKNIPASQFQEIGKKLRNKAIVKVPKKNLIFRALDLSKNEALKKLKEQIKDSIAILFSDIDCFDLAAELTKNKSLVRAKAGQEVPEDIEIPAGPTDLIPGPAVSELGALGIQIKIEKGKIHIKEPKIIVKKNEKISTGAADIMTKLDIKPFSVGFIPLSAFDTQEGKIYFDINVNQEETLEKLKTSFGKALAFSVEINYICEDTIKFLIGKAGMHEKVLSKFTDSEGSEDKVENKKIEKENESEDKEESESKKEGEEEKKEEVKEEEK